MRIVILAATLLVRAQAPEPRPSAAVVVAAVATLYSTPSFDSDVSSQLLLGEPLHVVAVKPGWAKVRGLDAYEGWMPQTQMRPLREGERPYASSGRVMRVEAVLGNAYREPDVTRHAPLIQLPYGVRLEVVGDRKDGRWVEVRLPGGTGAWVQLGDLTEDLRPLGLEGSLALARRFLGVTYTWGGGSALGLDCSGFTQLVVRSRGILMPRDADLQCAWSGVTPIEPAQLQAGDLLFFGSSLRKITHTGIHVGEGRFIHATAQGRPGVQVSRLADEPWAQLLVACRRLK